MNHEVMVWIKVQMEVDDEGNQIRYTYVPNQFDLSDPDNWEYVAGPALTRATYQALVRRAIDKAGPKLAAQIGFWQ